LLIKKRRGGGIGVKNKGDSRPKERLKKKDKALVHVLALPKNIYTWAIFIILFLLFFNQNKADSQLVIDL